MIPWFRASRVVFFYITILISRVLFVIGESRGVGVETFS